MDWHDDHKDGKCFGTYTIISSKTYKNVHKTKNNRRSMVNKNVLNEFWLLPISLPAARKVTHSDTVPYLFISLTLFFFFFSTRSNEHTMYRMRDVIYRASKPNTLRRKKLEPHNQLPQQEFKHTLPACSPLYRDCIILYQPSVGYALWKIKQLRGQHRTH